MKLALRIVLCISLVPFAFSLASCSDSPTGPPSDRSANEVFFRIDGQQLRGQVWLFNDKGFAGVRFDVYSDTNEPVPPSLHVESIRITVAGKTQQVTAIEESRLNAVRYRADAVTDFVLGDRDQPMVTIDLDRSELGGIQNRRFYPPYTREFGPHDCEYEDWWYVWFEDEASLAQLNDLATSLSVDYFISTWGESSFIVRVLEGEPRPLSDRLLSEPFVKSAWPSKPTGELWFRIAFVPGYDRTASIEYIESLPLEIVSENVNGKRALLEIDVGDDYDDMVAMSEYLTALPFVRHAGPNSCPVPLQTTGP